MRRSVINPPCRSVTSYYLIALFMCALTGMAGPISPLCLKAFADPLVQISPAQSISGDRVGRAVSVQSNRMALGAPFTDLAQSDAGAAYMYLLSFTGALPDGRITANDASAGSNFGYALSVSNGKVAVGAPGEDRGGLTDAGSVYVFRRDVSGWMQEQKITPPSPVSGQRFGASVALSGQVLFVGAPDEAGRSGAVYRYQFVSGAWQFQDRWTSSDPIPSQRFGYSLSTDGNWTAVGMLQNAPEGSEPGRVHMLLNMSGSWADAQIVSASQGTLDDRFGSSASVWGDTLVVGSMGLSTVAANSGGAYVFKLVGGAWLESQLLLPQIAQANQFAGHSVALSTGYVTPRDIYLGAPYHDNLVADTGAVFPFRYSSGGFVPTTTLRGASEETQDLFGFSVAASIWKGASRLVVGAPQDNFRGTNSGAAYLSRGFLLAVHAYALICLPPGC